MKFVMIKEYDWDLSKDKIILGKIKEEYTGYNENGTTYSYKHKHSVTLAYLLTISDFNEDDEYNILLNTNSIQIRPKAIYKNNKGYYKKVNNKNIFFNEEETEEIEKHIAKFTKYLNGKEDDNIE